jgi:hypothetical protein
MQLRLRISIQAVVFFIYLCVNTLWGCDNSHFYRARFWIGEPRFEKLFLRSTLYSVGAGGTYTARNCNGKTVPLLDLYGTQNFPTCPEQFPLLKNTIARLLETNILPLEATSIEGTFSIIEGIIDAAYNFDQGIFARFYLPIRRLEFSNINFRTHAPFKSWSKRFYSLLNTFNMSMAPTSSCGAGDLTLLIGATRNYGDTEYLDFIDATIQSGLLIPTGEEQSIYNPLKLPLGYDGHFALPFIADCSIGAYEWLTFGIHVESLFFFDHTTVTPLKTSEHERGFIRYISLGAKRHKGILVDAGAYLKADHVIHGLSCVVAYSYDHKSKDSVVACSKVQFNSSIASHDAHLQGWRMHTIHVAIEYDFATQVYETAPRIAFFYNAVLAGQQIFTTPFQGASCGFDISWVF